MAWRGCGEIRVHPIEAATIRAFIAANRRERWIAMLDSAKGRREQLDRLNHLRDLDERYVQWLDSNADVVGLLRAKGAPRECFVMSPVGEVDGRVMELEEAIEAIKNSMSGAIVSCVAGKLGLYCGEAGEAWARVW